MIIIMKNIFVFALLFDSMLAFARDRAMDTILQPAITQAGKCTGKITEKKLDKEGGELQSADGKLELIIPPDALSKKTNISIQSVTNLAPNDIAEGYGL
jgi:hypothetical protein